MNDLEWDVFESVLFGLDFMQFCKRFNKIIIESKKLSISLEATTLELYYFFSFLLSRALF